MFITKCNDLNFDWDEYFSNINNLEKSVPMIDAQAYFENNRKALAENNQKLGMSLLRLIRRLMAGIAISEAPQIIELGAGTGYLSRTLKTIYNGNITMIDNCVESYKAYLKVSNNNKEISYEIADILEYQPSRQYDIVCSFGVIEHFNDKTKVMECHRKCLKDDGYMIILVPMDSILSRLYFDTFPERNLGYRELLTKKELTEIVKQSGMVPLKVEISEGYVYDFVGAVCKMDRGIIV